MFLAVKCLINNLASRLNRNFRNSSPQLEDSLIFFALNFRACPFKFGGCFLTRLIENALPLGISLTDCILNLRLSLCLNFIQSLTSFGVQPIQLTLVRLKLLHA